MPSSLKENTILYFRILILPVSLWLILSFFVYHNTKNMIKRNKILRQEGVTAYAYVYDEQRSAKSSHFLYRLVIKGDTIHGRTRIRDGIQVGDSILIIYPRSNPNRNTSVQDTTISGIEAFICKVFDLH